MARKLLLLLFIALPAAADEGMWMPQQIPQLAGELKKLGFTIDPNRFADLTGDPMGAVVQIPGCTAAFVSPEGLIVTNHHCAYGSIQHNSTPERDLITDGFLAGTREEELPAAPGTTVWVTTKIEDVTARMNGGMKKDIEDSDRARQLDRREKELIAECEKPGGVRCGVASFFEGSQFLRTTRMEIKDVRLVYVPSAKIGDFGGEVDNFEWPRHTGDFGFYRAYVDGKPYRPRHYLKVSTAGVNDGDPVLVAGYPGRTYRYKNADEVRNYQEFLYPTIVRYYGELIRLLEKAGEGNRDVQIRNSSRLHSLANSRKNFQAVSEAFAKENIIEVRAQRDARIRAAAANDPAAMKALDEIARINAELRTTRERDLVLDLLVGRGSPMLAQAMTIVRLAAERPKKDVDRLAKYQQREWPNLKNASARAQRSIDPATDRAAVRYFLLEAASLPAGQRLTPIDEAVEAAGGIDQLLDHLYGATNVGSQEERAKMFEESSAQLEARRDPMLSFVRTLLPLIEAREDRDLAHSGAMARLRPIYFNALRAVSGGTLYPDANSTLRVTFGRVAGYRPKDATWYTPQTSLRGILEKETGKEPFEIPAPLGAAARDAAKTKPYIDAELEDVPVNFLSTCDTTGGNSGSPTLNAKGELVGLLFDGNYESIDSDFQFNGADTRSIHVDTQYMLWVMDAVDGAHALMRELGVTPKLTMHAEP
jgi:Peptidase S46